MLVNIIFWSGAGFISSYLFSNIAFYRYVNSIETPIFNQFTFFGFICGFIRGYTGKSIFELKIE
jgi:hypothetical protein